ncbi:hypothetical protein HK101_003964 [Irineochytrium annulatum]|nr:hypothetical protein HK101_003964 [Irineochytrium annulatum]
MILDLSRLLSWDTSPDASSCPPSFAPRGCDYHAPDDLDHALEILTRLLSSSPRSRVTIAIDSLDPFLLLLGPQRVFAFLSSLGTVTKDRDTARVVVAHRKTPYDFSARVDEAAALERIANGVAGLETLEEWVRRQGRSGRALFATTTGWDVAECVVMKKSGRSVRETLAYRRARNGVVLKGIDDIKSVAAVQEVPKVDDENSDDVQFLLSRSITRNDKSDPSANLTFNLRLTETQQEARAKHQLELPYFDAQAGSTIAFEAEAFDDDEFDPDDDLDI